MTRIANTLAALLIGMTCQAACAYGDSNLSAEIQCPSALVAGLPMPIQVVVEGDGQFVAIDILQAFNPLDVRLASTTNEYRFHTQVTMDVPGIPAYNPEFQIRTFPAPGVRILPAEQSTFVLDLSNLEINVQMSQGKRTVVRPDTLEPGEYRIIVSGVGLDTASESGPASITLLAPNAEEQRFLDRVYTLSSSIPVWRSFIARADEALDGIRIDRFSDLGRRQLQYQLLLARLVHSRLPVGDLSILPEDVEDLWLVYRTDCLILRYEIEMAAGRGVEAQVFRDAILAVRPSAKYQLDGIDTRGGLITAFRNAARKATTPP